ncbi:ABC transporter substrate-binding protein [Streptomyces sp. NBC_00597]|uniref:ABC transporter substrate-binding protein n=1 Tax=unclassified Streptomyces TaxID=2593676 RepID=UPI002E0E05AD|nr:ABC transporter substrate-binding protein [Streptomyces sp. NBC_01205]
MDSGIVFALDSMPLNSDSHWPADYDARFVGEALLGALSVEAGDGSLRTGSALAVERFDGGRRWRVTLDGEAAWSDGLPLSAEHALASVRTVLARPRSPLARLLYPELPTEPAVQVAADVVDYRFARPVSYVPSLLTLPQFAPSRESGTGADAPVLGPYEITGRGEDGIRMSLRDRAADERAGNRPRELEFRVFARTREALDALRRGEIDVSPTTSFSVQDVFDCAGVDGFQSRPISIFGSLEFGGSSGNLNRRPELRRALGFAVDRERIAERCPGLVIPFLYQTAPWSAVPPSSKTRRPTSREIDELRRELGGSLEIGYADFTPNDVIVRAVCDQLQEIFGITAVPRPLSYRAYVRSALSRDYSLLYTLTTADFPHPASLLTPWYSTGAVAKRLGFADAGLDALLDAASEETDPGAQAGRWAAADRRWSELMPRIPLIQVRAHCLSSGRLTGARLNSSGLIDFGRLAAGPRARTAAGPYEEARA